ncbi:MAG TPA: Stk1 family PASTA domain-containing Ser/Thr kinase [Bacillota bacterium]|nr:Stk1 family PASTA domain-containing Ser/Thr kinase [Bacillota bacterium]
MDFLGRTLSRRYDLVEQLGGGGMALVYRARDRYLNREVTVKILRPQYTSDLDFVERFRREAQAIASLSSPNIVSVYDVGEEEGIHFIVMEYIEGKNLKEVIREKGRLSIGEAVNYAKQICEGLEHAHQRGIVHRDVKPHNILVTSTGRVKVTDFGIAKAITSDAVTQAGTIIGSVHYIAPEQAKGEAGGIRSDLYSVGVVLYEMVTGQLPFEGDTPIAMAMKHIQEEPVSPGCLNPEISPELEKVILRAMAKAPEKRYQRAWEMAVDLGTVLSGQISEATQMIDLGDCPTMLINRGELEKNGPDKKKKAPARRRMLIAGILLMVFGLLGGALLGYGSLFLNREVVVPNVVGLTPEQAKLKLEEKHLGFKVVEEQNTDKQPKGLIFLQDPEADQKAKENRVVEVLVSLGPVLYPVPDVRGKPLEEAKITIETSQMKLGEPSEVYDENVPAGTVISQSPDPDVEKEKPMGTTIDLTVSKGPQPQFITVPNVVGLSQQAAADTLAANKLLMAKTGDVPSNEYFAGIVVSQDPAAGQGKSIEEGSKVTVQVSQGPGPQAKNYKLQYDLPNDSQIHSVKVVIIDKKDAQGRTEYEEDHAGGEHLDIPVKVYGTGGRYELYVDNQLILQGSVQ